MNANKPIIIYEMKVCLRGQVRLYLTTYVIGVTASTFLLFFLIKLRQDSYF